MEHVEFVLPVEHDRPILGDVHLNKNREKKPVVVFCHGYKGYKDWGAWNVIARQFAVKGYVFVKFNFSHNGGTIDNPIDFPDLEAFGKNTYSIESYDLGVVLDHIESGELLPNEIDANQIYLIGHSRGGGMVTLKAGQDSRVKKVVSWAGVSDYANRFPSGEELEKWERDGVRYVLNGRTKQNMPHYYSFYEDFQNNREQLDIEKAARNINVPQLIIHGSEDMAVTEHDAQQLKSWNPNAQLEIIQGAGHTFDTKHPWDREDLPEHMQKAVDLTLDFL